jgi:Predicted metal-dependent enzyme
VSEEVLLGGQAVLEGVMMRAPGAYAVAVRKKGGEVVTLRREVIRLSDRYPALKMPVLRGVVVLFQSLALGIRALNFSAEQVLEEEDSRPEKKSSGSFGIFLSLLLALAFALGLFFYLPLLLTEGLVRLAPVLKGSLPFNLVEGTIRIALFIGYILAISALSDMRRVFQYHGAEHKVVSTYEAGEPLTVEFARTHSTLHPRCGTSFLLFVMVISVLTFSLVPTSASFGVKLASRLFLLPLIAGLSFELLRSSAKHRGNLIYAAVVTPGMWMQRLTTREPNDDQLQVAIEALRVALGGTLPERREAFPL